MPTPPPDDPTHHDPDLVAVVSAIAGARRAQRLTQTDVADRARLSQPTVSRVEAYDRVSFPTIATYARAVGWRVVAVPDDVHHWPTGETPPEPGDLA
jgi:transcriptional regulator with XRE-family HTH domain